MRIIILILIITLNTTAALAQEQQLPPTIKERVMGDRILQEINEVINCKVSKFELETEITKLKAKINELESKNK